MFSRCDSSLDQPAEPAHASAPGQGDRSPADEQGVRGHEPDTLLCESCGYPIEQLLGDSRGPGLAADCPECGQPLADSLPEIRCGPPWEGRRTFLNWCLTVAVLLTRPRRTFRELTLEGPNLGGRLFLLINVCVVGVVVATASLVGHGRGGLTAWLVGMLAAKAVLLLTYTEALGVSFFSRRHGWRVPLGLAERIVCYASIGWVPASLLLAFGSLSFGRWVRWAALLPVFAVGSRLAEALVGLLVAAVLFLCFELLVWTGIRQCRFANRPRQAQPPC